MPTVPVTGRADLTDAQWAVLEPLLPRGNKPGRRGTFTSTTRWTMPCLVRLASDLSCWTTCPLLRIQLRPTSQELEDLSHERAAISCRIARLV